jgi:glycosyltransferase involved in cell wall biosynthesis
MKILLVSNFFKPSWETGGVTKVNYEISKNLVARGHKVTVYTTDGYSSRLDVTKNRPVCVDGINVYYFYNLSRSLVKKMKLPTPYYLPFVMRKEIKNFDVIHIHEHRTLLAACVHYYAKKYNVPYVLQAHGSVLPFLQKQKFKKIFDFLIGNKILHDASKLIAVSDIEVEQYKQMGIDVEKIDLISNGIDVCLFDNLPEKGTFRKKFGVTENHVILYLGRLNERKGIDFLIKTYAELKKDIADCVLVLAGSDDGYKNKLDSIINELNLSQNVKFTGYISTDEKVAAYVDADVLVYPSIFEIFGLVPFEAIMSGTPIIVTDDCGCGELVRDSKCGYLVEYGNVSDLKNKMKSTIENASVRNSFVKNGQEYVLKNLTWEQVVEKMEGCYENCIRNV